MIKTVVVMLLAAALAISPAFYVHGCSGKVARIGWSLVTAGCQS